MPELAGIVEAPQSAAKAALDRKHCGLSPAAISKAAALSGPMPLADLSPERRPVCDPIELPAQHHEFLLQMAATFRQGAHRQTGCRQWAGGHLLISFEAAVDQLSGIEVLESLPQL